MGMARLIDADGLKMAVRDDANIDGRNYARVKRHINEAEAVELVMCKDCKNWIHMEDGMGDCTNRRFHLDGHADPTMEMDGFCSLGERKDNG